MSPSEDRRTPVTAPATGPGPAADPSGVAPPDDGPPAAGPLGAEEVDVAGRWAAVALLVLTVGQLLVAVAFPDVPRFSNKGFLARLAAYPALMLVVPAVWTLATRRGPGPRRPLPWTEFALLMLPFAVDVTGNSLDLYDRLAWWDDANHFLNWFLLCLGGGLLLARARVRPAWVLGLAIAGGGAFLAVLWELAEYIGFIRGGTEQYGVYVDTLGDEILGSTGATVAGAVVVAWVRRLRRADAHRARLSRW